jgi:hypothetical protein
MLVELRRRQRAFCSFNLFVILQDFWMYFREFKQRLLRKRMTPFDAFLGDDAPTIL